MPRIRLLLGLSLVFVPGLWAQPSLCYKCVSIGGGSRCFMTYDQSGKLECYDGGGVCTLIGANCSPSFLGPDGQLQVVSTRGGVLDAKTSRSTTRQHNLVQVGWKGSLVVDCRNRVVARAQTLAHAVAVRNSTRRLII